MAKIIAICGKICSGKTYYANQLKSRDNAVILSCDELTKSLFDKDLGEKHDEITTKIQNYLLAKSVEFVNAGCNIILDWGFWSAESRHRLTTFCRLHGIMCEWHYIDLDDQTWQRNISERNCRIQNGLDSSNYYLDDGLMQKLLSLWESPSAGEINVWHKLERNL